MNHIKVQDKYRCDSTARTVFLDYVAEEYKYYFFLI